MCAKAAWEFMKRFYIELLNRESVSDAVSAVRKSMFTKREHLSPKGDLEL